MICDLLSLQCIHLLPKWVSFSCVLHSNETRYSDIVTDLSRIYIFAFEKWIEAAQLHYYKHNNTYNVDQSVDNEK